MTKYNYAVANEAIAQGIITEIWVPENESCPDNDITKSILGSPFLLRTNIIGKLKYDIIIRSIELRKIFINKGLDRDTVVLIPSIYSNLLLYLTSYFLGTLRLEIKPYVIIVLRFGFRDCGIFLKLGKRLKPLLPLTFHMMRYLNKKKNVYFCSDSNLITEELISEGICNATTIPIPHLPPYFKGNINNRLTIGFFGGARFDKGFDLLPEIIEKTIRKYPNVYFYIQAYRDQGKQMISEIEKLHYISKCHPDKIEIVDNYLSDLEYAQAMRKCSIILIPYRTGYGYYNKNTSGILTEVIACGAWAIVPSGTWMAAQSNNYSKIVTFDGQNHQSILKSIYMCMDHCNKFNTEMIDDQIKRWYSYHSPYKYINSIIKLIEP